MDEVLVNSYILLRSVDKLHGEGEDVLIENLTS